MYIGAISGLTASAGARRWSIVCRASASGDPRPSRRAAVASARYSRWRDTPSCSSTAARGARVNATSDPNRPRGLSSGSSPNRNESCRMFAIAEIAPAIVAATEETRMSRFRMCASSCASTPETCSCGRLASKPSVIASAACCGVRPVAKALGCSPGVTYSRGIGMPARAASSRAVACTRGESASSSGCARLRRSAMRSE